ncbi:HU family DNA-binding protein [Balneolaceae bacterium YR4-1]|uniref:HU family DNA-binding protein n=1 Tax=Halalkalibaculum roseum TaxID=2709311 RepID=A0A6M1T2L3_9BACT|nr:HU family DNA-binding protein [Halalkalibaculum roseum]NGP77754.1 HU family DNA-binding protein [Halalkalibaculum roseum]
MDQKFLGAFSEILREEIAKKNEVSVDGLGVFKPEHKKQYQKQFDDGRVVMMPPKDLITFVADKKLMNDSE